MNDSETELLNLDVKELLKQEFIKEFNIEQDKLLKEEYDELMGMLFPGREIPKDETFPTFKEFIESTKRMKESFETIYKSGIRTNMTDDVFLDYQSGGLVVTIGSKTKKKYKRHKKKRRLIK